MKCLSLKQPFADLIVDGKKTIELRNWNTSFRGSFLVHASGNLDYSACELFKMEPESLVRRAVIGEATLYDVKEYKNSEVFLQDKEKHLATDQYIGSRYGFLLKDAKKFEKPIYIPGRLGFFEVDITLPKPSYHS
ncbi:MAG: ASCH domain-containing protein [Candidatus Micrarchaeales archaeon]|jgi:predicted transcriptional regulator